MKLHETRPVTELEFPLSAVKVVPVRDPAECALWDRTMDERHYLGFRGMFGESLRHVAIAPDGEWLALLGWCSAVLKVGARDRWIGWLAEQRVRRLRLVANNSRFLVLDPYRVPNLASRVLALSARRLSADMMACFGHPVLLAETFVDPTRFRGSCYLAAGWEEAGKTRGFARTHDGWKPHGQPKTVLMRSVAKDAIRDLTGLDELAAWHLPPPKEQQIPAPTRLRSLFEHFDAVSDFRSARGIRHKLPTVLAVAVAARLTGTRGTHAIAQFAGQLDQQQLREVKAFRSPKTGKLTLPSSTSFYRLLDEIDPVALDQSVRDFAAAQFPPGGLATDGKIARGSRHGKEKNDECWPVGALLHDSGVTPSPTTSD